MSDTGIWAVGRRKTAVARIKLTKGSGAITVNGQKEEEYFVEENQRTYFHQPLAATGLEGQFDIHVNVKGGGKVGQSGAVRHGIARALIEQDAELRTTLKQSGLLTRDARKKERLKPGQPGARKRFQFSKR